MKKLRRLEETLERVARVSRLEDKIVSITRVRKQPTTAQKKRLLLAFFAEMERVISGAMPEKDNNEGDTHAR